MGVVMVMAVRGEVGRSGRDRKRRMWRKGLEEQGEDGIVGWLWEEDVGAKEKLMVGEKNRRRRWATVY